MELKFTSNGLYNIQATQEELISFMKLLQNKNDTPSLLNDTSSVIENTSEFNHDKTNIKDINEETIFTDYSLDHIKVNSQRGRKPIGKVSDSVPLGYLLTSIILEELDLPSNYNGTLYPFLNKNRCPHVIFDDKSFFSFEDAIKLILNSKKNMIAKEKVKIYLEKKQVPDYEKYHIPEGYFSVYQILKRNHITNDPSGVRTLAKNYNCSSIKINMFEFFKEDELLDILMNKRKRKLKNANDTNVNNNAKIEDIPDGYYTATQFCEFLNLKDNYIASLHPFLKNHKCRFVRIKGTYYYDGQQAFEFMKKARNGSILKNAYDQKFKEETSDQDFYHWKKKYYSKIKDAGLDVGKICSLVFKRMTDIYGINWDQVSRDFYRYNHRMPASRIESAYFLETDYKHGASGKERYENLFSVNLDHILEEFVKE